MTNSDRNKLGTAVTNCWEQTGTVAANWWAHTSGSCLDHANPGQQSELSPRCADQSVSHSCLTARPCAAGCDLWPRPGIICDLTGAGLDLGVVPAVQTAHHRLRLLQALGQGQPRLAGERDLGAERSLAAVRAPVLGTVQQVTRQRRTDCRRRDGDVSRRRCYTVRAST